MAIKEKLAEFVEKVRRDRAANPAIAGDGTALELLVAPSFQQFVQESVDELSQRGWRVLPEYRRPGLGRPDLAFALPNAPARAFIELKEPRKSIESRDLVGHDRAQFERFGELPLWALTNVVTIKLYKRATLVDEAPVLPEAAYDPATSEAEVERILERQDTAGLERILDALAQAQAPTPADAREAAAVLAHAARLVREIVLAQSRAGLDPVSLEVRATFNETLFARAEAGGYDVRDMDQLFAGAFAQTLVFGLLLAKDAAAAAVDEHAYQHLPETTYPLLRGTLRALTLDEVRAMLGVGFEITLDAVNSIAPETLALRNGRDPMLYLYEDFLRVFDPAAVARYGVYYTPPEVVELMVAETERELQGALGTEGLLDDGVRLLDPACGTGTFMIGAADRAARRAEAEYGPAMVGPALSAFAARMFGFELLVGPYTVAHYRMAREVLSRGGGVPPIPIYLTDTLAPPADERRVDVHLGFMGAPMVTERLNADEVKRDGDILAIIGNPPYKRLKKGEIERLVGRTMNEQWEDLKRPVRDAGYGLSLNAFPDLCIAFYRWALWRLFEAEGARGRGVLAYVTNRTFLTSAGYGGLRQMLRERFDTIRIIDLRGNNRGALPATVGADDNVFNIEVGVCVLIATASGERQPGSATVRYSDFWKQGAFRRRDKLELAARTAEALDALTYREVPGTGMARFKPPGFEGCNWPSVNELFRFRSNGVVTYRDDFSYATTREKLIARLQAWYAKPADEAAKEFKETRDRKAGPAHQTAFEPNLIHLVEYRPLDRRALYNRREFIDFPKEALQAAWGQENFGLMVLPSSTGAGPAIWSHGYLPDQHAFRGSYGGWIYPLIDPAIGGSFVSGAVLAGLAVVYGGEIGAAQLYDAVLALLSATSYTTLFAHDLEDDFPHVPLPASRDLFNEAAAIGAQLRELQGFRREPPAAFRTARLHGDPTGRVLGVPTPARAFRVDGDGHGEIWLTRDGEVRIIGVSERVWRFAVSGYQLVYKWLKARDGEAMQGPEGVRMLRGALDLVWRVEALITLNDEADEVLARAVDLTLTREELHLRAPEVAVEEADGEAD